MVATAIYNYWSDDVTGRGAQSKKGPEGVVGCLQGIHSIQHGSKEQVEGVAVGRSSGIVAK